ncbi:MAG: CarD family transcriptional regulator, partial [Deltaproteobacteria bacterium]|nr:CarD family transcriptional regulator [Deltaproteobacteria bacterium]
MFKVGDLVVYPAHGVGKITSIEAKAILGTPQEFFTIEILESG